MIPSAVPGSVIVRPETLSAWSGATLLIAAADGALGDAFSGLYFREARFLRTCRLELAGERPWLCEAAPVGRDALHFAYVYPELHGGEGGGTGQAADEIRRNAAGIPQRALEITVEQEVRTATLTIIATVVNRARERVAVDLTWRLDADFADIQEAYAGQREQDVPIAIAADGRGVSFTYQHPRLPFATHIRATPGFTWNSNERTLTMPLSLGPQERIACELRVAAVVGDADAETRDHETRAAWLEDWRSRFARLESSNTLALRIVHANLEDVASMPLLEGPRDEWLALQAGFPLYPAFFGRDALTAGWQIAMIDGGAALDAALTKLGRWQSDRQDDWRDEEPGRIPYQMRRGPLAMLGVNPFAASYADFASPLMFVIAAANLFAWTGDRARLDAHWDHARRILDWAAEYGDADRDGYLEYRTRSPRGPKNQGWKDSGDAIVDDRGQPLEAPIATCELQGYWFAAQQLMGLLCAARGEMGDARAWAASAAALKERFNRDWWSEREHCIPLAMDKDKRVADAVTSNVGHCLASGIIAADRATAVVGRLFAPDMFSGWGIRTLSSAHAAYDPVSYHRGSVWAVEQATIVFGLRRFGFEARAHDLTSGLFDLAQLYPGFRIPECVGGYARSARPTPGAYPRANAPQLWNASAFPLAVQAMLGAVPWAPAHLLLLDPALPEWLPDLTIEDLRVGDASVSLRCFRRDDGTSDYEVLDRRGTLHIIRQPSPDSLNTGPADRIWAVVSSFFK